MKSEGTKNLRTTRVQGNGQGARGDFMDNHEELGMR